MCGLCKRLQIKRLCPPFAQIRHRIAHASNFRCVSMLCMNFTIAGNGQKMR